MNTFNGEAPEPTGARAAQRDATRAAILAAARLAFEAHGFDGANIRDIAAGAGVAAGTVIHHFGDKRDLLHAALYEDLQGVLDGALAALGTGTSSGDPGGLQGLVTALSTLATTVFDHYAARPALARAQLRESLFADPPWSTRFAEQTTRTHAAIVDVASRHRDALPPTVDPTLMAAAWLSFFYFGLIGWTQGQLVHPVAFVDALTRQHLGLPTRAPPDDDTSSRSSP
jgi:AcrR family transcriptional regulator